MSRYNQANPAYDSAPFEQAGYTHTGANYDSKVDFYERPGPGGTEKIDYYGSTGTIKTSMNHPNQGPTQMFRRDLSDSEFSNVVEYPRYHTGKGYQTKGRR